MYKLVIADDEQVIRQGLTSMKWEDIGVSIVSVATNGLECMEQIRMHHPDIVCADIRMPGLTGIEIARQAIIENISAKFIFLTGFADFEYAKQSIELEVVSFVLKPSSPEELFEAVIKAKEKIDLERKAIKEKEDIHKQLRESNLALIGKMHLEGEQNENGKVQQLIEFLEANFKEDVTLDMASKAVHISPEYLSRLIKKETGSTFLEHLTRIRLKKACELLSDLNYKITCIADQVGYGGSGYFSQLFKKYYGLTPSEFRQEMINCASTKDN